MTEDDLLEMEAENPLYVIVVDGPTLHYPIQQAVFTGWNSNQWHDDLPITLPSNPANNYDYGDLGTDGNPITPVILYFDSAVDCPSINGSTVIVGIVYYEKENCTNQGWGGGKIYGTFAKAGDITSWNANAEIIATSLDFGGTGGGSGGNREFSTGISSRIIVLPGTWKDY